MPHPSDELSVPTPGSSQGVERRGSPRVEWPATADLLKRVAVGRDGGPVHDHGRTVNISLTGVLLAVPHASQPGEQLELRFPLDRGEEMAVVAQVVRVDGRGIPSGGEWLLGCQFVALPVEERCRLAKFLMRRRKAIIDAHALATGRA